MDEIDEMECTRRSIERLGCSCAWDVGANIGNWMLFLAGLRPPIQRVVCFEPDENNVRILRLNQERNALQHVAIHALALSSQAGEATFYADPVTGRTGSLERGTRFIERYYDAKPIAQRMTISTADEQIAAGVPAPDFIKIDVEGHELAFLQGAKGLIASQRPTIVIEVTQNHEEVATLLAAAGYRMFHSSELRPLELPMASTLAIHSDRLAIAGLA